VFLFFQVFNYVCFGFGELCGWWSLLVTVTTLVLLWGQSPSSPIRDREMCSRALAIRLRCSRICLKYLRVSSSISRCLLSRVFDSLSLF